MTWTKSTFWVLEQYIVATAGNWNGYSYIISSPFWEHHENFKETYKHCEYYRSGWNEKLYELWGTYIQENAEQNINILNTKTM